MSHLERKFYLWCYQEKLTVLEEKTQYKEEAWQHDLKLYLLSSASAIVPWTSVHAQSAV